jgi:ABC-type cobalamin/Fe3+-siderophores transport system ATPase subunit
MSTGSKTIEVEDLRLAYAGREVLHGISFDIHRNEIFGIIGPAQSGKSSLLLMLQPHHRLQRGRGGLGLDPAGRRGHPARA